jgi:hypothetical protein
VDTLVEFKSQAETVRVYTVQKQLGKDAELAAAELVRRAERGIVLAIRKGQERGEIETRTDALSRASRSRRLFGDRSVDTESITKESVASFVSADEMTGNGAGIAHLADGVTDDQFDAAIEKAKAEGNLSRANVVRKVRNTTAPPPSKLAMPQPPRYGSGNRRKHLQVLQALTATLDGATHAADAITDLDGSVTQEEAAQLARDLSRQIQSLNRIKALLKERIR